MNSRRHPRHKPRLLLAATLLFLGISAISIATADDPKAPTPGARRAEIAAFMRAKLESSQSVLEGLVTGDFDKIRSGAERMAVMSTAAEWHVIPGEDYKRRSEAFRAIAQRLVKMADEKNEDGAALAYVQLTMSCVDCHRAVRNPGVAQLPRLSAGPVLAVRTVPGPRTND